MALPSPLPQVDAPADVAARAGLALYLDDDDADDFDQVVEVLRWAPPAAEGSA